MNYDNSFREYKLLHVIEGAPVLFNLCVRHLGEDE